MDDVTTNIENSSVQTTSQMYDLLGRSVDENYKGVVVIKGQKYLLK